MLRLRFLPTPTSLLDQANVPFIHRDISWLQFNERVLAEARTPQNPVLERLKFLAISASNLDEFFSIRYCSFQNQNRIRKTAYEVVTKMTARQEEALELISDELSQNKVLIYRKKLNQEEHGFISSEQIFREEILPKLGPPEVFGREFLKTIKNHDAFVLFENGIAVKIPKVTKAIYLRENSISTFMKEVFFLDHVLLSHLNRHFHLPGASGLFRLTRNADITADLEDEDPETVPDVIRGRIRKRDLGKATRLQYSGDLSETHIENCIKLLSLMPDQVFSSNSTVYLNQLWSVYSALAKETPELAEPMVVPHFPEVFSSPDKIFDYLKRSDILLHHPYDSFDAFVRFIENSCNDPKVTEISLSVYRTDAYSPIINALLKAAKTKSIHVVVELRARFDELNNLRLSEELKAAGVKVSFGFGNLKLHAKVTLITRQENEKDVRYAHLSTGNYNAATARIYTDLAILTSNEDVCLDAKLFFDSIHKGDVPKGFKKLVSAPTQLHRKLTSLIEVEKQAAIQKKSARIFAKVNALVDHNIIEKLYDASCAGVTIDLVVRGACSLIPGVKGLSENIRVISLVDRFLEHSRIYYFENSKALYLSSADWMPRNFFSRIELAFPVLDPSLYEHVKHIIIPTYLNDTAKAKELTPQGTWKARCQQSNFVSPQRNQLRAQVHFQELSKKLDMTELALKMMQRNQVATSGEQRFEQTTDPTPPRPSPENIV